MPFGRIKLKVVLLYLPQKFPGITQLLGKPFQLIFSHKINQRCIKRDQINPDSAPENNVGGFWVAKNIRLSPLRHIAWD